MNVRYSARAVADIAEIFQYIAKQDLATALAVEADIRSTCEGVAEFPYASPRTDIANVFRAPVKRRGFTIFYRGHGCLWWRSSAWSAASASATSRDCRNPDRAP
jgi:plasmid stabilization system protein ParE